MIVRLTSGSFLLNTILSPKLFGPQKLFSSYGLMVVINQRRIRYHTLAFDFEIVLRHYRAIPLEAFLFGLIIVDLHHMRQVHFLIFSKNYNRL